MAKKRDKHVTGDGKEVSLCSHPPFLLNPKKCECGYPVHGPGVYVRRREWKDGQLMLAVRAFCSWDAWASMRGGKANRRLARAIATAACRARDGRLTAQLRARETTSLP